MRSSVLLSAGLLPLVAVGETIFGVFVGETIVERDTCSVDTSIEYLTCLVLDAGPCYNSLAEEAKDWCRAYLSIEPVTSYLSTSVPVVQETATETSTTLTTTTELTTITTETTSTLTTTDVVTEATTTMVTAGATLLSKRTLSAAPGCPTVNQRHFLRQPASGLSSACSCLNPGPSTVTLPVTTAPESTATETETTIVAGIVSETSVLTETSVTQVTEEVTVTSTSTATATATPAPDRCLVGYNTSGNGLGNTVRTVTSTGAYACCELCGTTPNCVASASVGTICQLLVKQVQLAGAPVNAQCPLGVESYSFGTPGGIVYKGPCGA